MHVDTLVYSVSGVTRFQVAGRKAGSAPTIDATLAPGDAVWAPALHYRRVVGGDEAASLILSIGFKPPRARRGEKKKSTEKRAQAQVQELLRNGGDFWGKDHIDLGQPTGLSEDMFNVTQLSRHRNSTVLVIDIPRDSDLLS